MAYKTLIIYSTVDGHTKKISNYIAEKLEGNTVSTTVCNISSVGSINLSDFDNVIVGASIRYGKYRKQLYDFLKINLDFLNDTKSAFFSVNVVARKEQKNTPETNPYTKNLFKKIQWQPILIGVFAGKVNYPHYNFVNKMIIKFIMFITKGPTNTSQVYEFTNWELVDDFIDEFRKRSHP